MRWFRFRGMIKPGLALSYDDARKVYLRKGIWMVEYLRARRHHDGMTGYFRRKYFDEQAPIVRT